MVGSSGTKLSAKIPSVPLLRANMAFVVFEGSVVAFVPMPLPEIVWTLAVEALAHLLDSTSVAS